MSSCHPFLSVEVLVAHLRRDVPTDDEARPTVHHGSPHHCHHHDGVSHMAAQARALIAAQARALIAAQARALIAAQARALIALATPDPAGIARGSLLGAAHDAAWRQLVLLLHELFEACVRLDRDRPASTALHSSGAPAIHGSRSATNRRPGQAARAEQVGHDAAAEARLAGTRPVPRVAADLATIERRLAGLGVTVDLQDLPHRTPTDDEVIPAAEAVLTLIERLAPPSERTLRARAWVDARRSR